MTESTQTREIPAAAWHDAVASSLGAGRFLGLWAEADDDGRRVALAVAEGPAHTVLWTRAADDRVPTVVDVVPAAEWDEREARDQFGVGFDGHAPLHPLVEHSAPTSTWATPVLGEDVHQIAVGPIHAGVIESGHFRFHVVGDRILHLDLRLFYKHRGLEAAALGVNPEQAVRLAQRACAACAVTNAVATAQAYEDSIGATPDEALRRGRTALLELERLYNHLNDIGAVCAGIGFAPGAMAFAELKERAQRVNADLTGHRFLFDAVGVGQSRVEFTGLGAARARAEIATVVIDAADLWREIERNRSVGDRLRGAGRLGADEAARLGTVGPAGRASASGEDARSDSPRLWYPGFVAAAPPQATGDVAARTAIRARELVDCGAILDELLSVPVGPGRLIVDGPGSGLGLGVVESPRGRTLVVVRHAGDRLQRLHLRTGSYANWPSLAAATGDAIIPDFPLINKSFELCYACVDR